MNEGENNEMFKLCFSVFSCCFSKAGSHQTAHPTFRHQPSPGEAHRADHSLPNLPENSCSHQAAPPNLVKSSKKIAAAAAAG